MKSKGFTLVELLGVIFILALLGILIVPVVSNILNGKKQDLYNVQIRNIEEGARNYVSEHILEINIPIDSSRGITLGTLQQAGYVMNDIVDPLTRQRFSSDMLIIIKNTSNGFEYKVCTSNVSCESVTML